MNKQVEAIRQEIERLKIDYLNRSYTFVPVAMEQLLDFVDSLPEESKVDVTDFCKPIDPGIAQCIADNWWEMLGEEEKPSEDLEEAAKEYSERVSGGHNYRDLTCGFIAGAEWQKEQMMKEVVEGEVWESGHGLRDVVLQTEPFQKVMKGLKEGDKVNIIIVKQ